MVVNPLWSRPIQSSVWVLRLWNRTELSPHLLRLAFQTQVFKKKNSKLEGFALNILQGIQLLIDSVHWDCLRAKFSAQKNSTKKLFFKCRGAVLKRISPISIGLISILSVWRGILIKEVTGHYFFWRAVSGKILCELHRGIPNQMNGLQNDARFLRIISVFNSTSKSVVWSTLKVGKWNPRFVTNNTPFYVFHLIKS